MLQRNSWFHAVLVVWRCTKFSTDISKCENSKTSLVTCLAVRRYIVMSKTADVIASNRQRNDQMIFCILVIYRTANNTFMRLQPVTGVIKCCSKRPYVLVHCKLAEVGIESHVNHNKHRFACSFSTCSYSEHPVCLLRRFLYNFWTCPT